MVKKKQPDFQKKQLRVGKPRPKGANVTNTSFKSKKLSHGKTPKKPNSPYEYVNELINPKNTKVITKKQALINTRSYVGQNTSTLSSYFSLILKKAGKSLLEDDKRVRQEAAGLIKACLPHLSTVQMNCFISVLVSELDCMMTHVHKQIRKESLDLLKEVLQRHPSLVPKMMKLLRNLLNLISTGEQEKRKLHCTISNSIHSTDWMNQVLRITAEFLRKLVDVFAKQKKPPDTDQNKVYWDEKHPLYLPIYAGSGIAPAKIDPYLTSQVSESKINQELRLIFAGLVKVTSSIIRGIPCASKILQLNAAQQLKTVIDTLCCMADWYRLGFKIDPDKDNKLIKYMGRIICDELMKGFYYSLHSSTAETTETNSNKDICCHLNLGICYLYTTFIIGTEYSYDKGERDCIICLCDTLSVKKNSKIETKSLFLMLKSVRNLIEWLSQCPNESRIFKSEMSEILGAFCELMDGNTNKEELKALHTLFIDISLSHEYRFVWECHGMKSWFNRLMLEMRRMKLEKKSNRKLLKCINTLCCWQNPCFTNTLNDTDPLDIISYLKFEDEDFQYTAMNMLTSMENLPPDTLQNISEFILCDPCITVKTVVRLVRLWHDRFMDDEVPASERIEFLKFLLNLAVDVVALDKAQVAGSELIQIADAYTMLETEHGHKDEHMAQYDKYKPLDEVFKSISYNYKQISFPFRILPPFPNKEKHAHILDVCIECLSLFPDKAIIHSLISEFFQELVGSNVFFPAHSAVALCKIAKLFRTTVTMNIFDEMRNSILFYISILTNEIASDKLKGLGLKELQENLCLDLNPNTCMSLLEMVMPRMFEAGLNGKSCLHILRIVKFMYFKDLIDDNYLNNCFSPVLQSLENYCYDGTEEQATLYDLYEMGSQE